MSIEHFYIVAGYGVWIYVLFCVFIKLVLDRRGMHKEFQKKEKIRKFFSKEIAARKKLKYRKRLMQYAKNDELFDYICEIYLLERERYTKEENARYRKFLTKIIRMKTKGAGGKGVLYRAYLIKRISQCRLRSRYLEKFVAEYREEYEQRWEF